MNTPRYVHMIIVNIGVTLQKDLFSVPITGLFDYSTLFV